MKSNLLLSTAIIASALAIAGCESDRTTEYPDRTPETTTMTDASKGSNLDKTDLDFLREAAHGGLLEVRISTDALKRNNLSPEEREFAQQMVDQHEKVNKELASLAARRNASVPTELDSSASTKAGKLAGSDDKGFPERYLECQVDAHKKAISLFEDESSDGKDAEVKEFASKTLPHLRAHLDTAKTLEAKH